MRKQHRHVARRAKGERWSVVGPGLIVAATGVGAGDLVAALVAGEKYGLALVWAIALGCILKFALNEGVGRWHMLSGTKIFEGWHSLGPVASGYFIIYTIIWGFVYGAAATSSAGLALNAMVPAIPVWGWAVICALLSFALTIGTKYRGFERIMSFLVVLMFVTVVGAAVWVLPGLRGVWNTTVPSIPGGSIFYVLGLIGGVGGTITMASYGYWLEEKGWSTRKHVSLMRWDCGTAYLVTGVFALAMLILGTALLYGSGVSVEGEEDLIKFAGLLSAETHPAFRWLFLVGFWAASFTSVLGVWNGVSYLFADFMRRIRKLNISDSELSSSFWYKFYVFWLTFPPMLLHFLGRPVTLIIAYGALGALFMPFLAITLLWLLNSPKHRAERNPVFSNVLLVLALVLFTILAVNELAGLFLGR
jgi:Mn2+/Fe2+ NRAMP family transporter